MAQVDQPVLYNKRRAKLQAQVGTRSTKRLRRLTVKRNRKVKHLLHIASRRVIDHLVDRGIGTLVIGYNPNWKQQVNLGRVKNQKFVSIPQDILLDMLTYKAQLAGIQVVLPKESYTSKSSFLDGESAQKRDKDAEKRIARGLFWAADGTLINADVIAAFISAPKRGEPKHSPRLSRGQRGVVVHPVRAMLSQTE